MSQSAPRKFSEKIAILERKQNEEEELFHHVMRDVRAITGSNVRSSATPTETACASSTGYPKNTGIQNNAGTSGVQQMQQMSDPNTLSLNWNRSGGSLPNVIANFCS
jgi:hypothetical protein